MRKSLRSLVLASFVMSSVLFAACGHGRVKLDETNSSVSKDGVISVSVSWIKMKSDRYDIGLNVTNDSKKPFIFLLSEMQCFKGTYRGVLKHTFFNTGERIIDFRPGQRKEFRMLCSVAKQAEGPARVVISKVYSNPEEDGATTGPVIAENIEWKYNESK